MATPTPSPDRGSDQTTPYVEDVTDTPTASPADEPAPRTAREDTPQQMSLEEAKKNLEDAEAAETGDDV